MCCAPSHKQATHLPTDAKERKAVPLATGVFDYFPDALVELAGLSKAGNDQHNPGKPLNWSKGKSTDHDDCLLRHFVDRKFRDADGQRHRTKVVWRALASLQIEIEAERANMTYEQYIKHLEDWEGHAVHRRGPQNPLGQ